MIQMNKKILSEVKEKIYGYVAKRRLREAFSQARSLAETMMDFESADALQRSEETYCNMPRPAPKTLPARK